MKCFLHIHAERSKDRVVGEHRMDRMTERQDEAEQRLDWR